MTIALAAFPLAAVLAVLLIGAATLARMEVAVRQQMVQSLETTLQATHGAMRIWISERKHLLHYIASNRGLRAYMDSALAARKGSAQAPDLQIPDYLDKLLSGHDAWHYFIIDTTQACISSKGEDSTAVRQIARQRPDLMDRLFAGSTVIIPPIEAKPKSGIRPTVSRPTMFAATPLRTSSGSIIAALIVRLDPLLTFSDVAHIGRIGKTGETYFFDRHARMVTESRFTRQLQKIGLIPRNAPSILNVLIRNPGVDMTQGEYPTVPIEQRPLTLMARSALAKHAGYSASGYRDYRGVRVLGAWLWDKQLGIGLATEINENEALATYYTMRNLFAWALALTVVIAGIAFFGLLTLRRKAEKQLHALAMFPDKNPMPVLRIDKPLNVSYANVPALPFLELIQDSDGNLSSPEWRKLVARIFKDGCHRSLEIELKGTIYSFLLTPIPENGIIYAYGQDVTQQKWVEDRLRELSLHDSLTGLSNRRHFDEFLHQQWRRLMRSGGRIALLFIDIDHFKNYNDRHGHQAGDACLKKIAGVIAGMARRAGDFAARYGGEEFVVVLSHVESSLALDSAETLRHAIEDLAIPTKDTATPEYVTASIGLACAIPDAELSISRFVEEADKALYRAKCQGRNRTEFVAIKNALMPQHTRKPI